MLVQRCAFPSMTMRIVCPKSSFLMKVVVTRIQNFALNLKAASVADIESGMSVLTVVTREWFIAG